MGIFLFIYLSICDLLACFKKRSPSGLLTSSALFNYEHQVVDFKINFFKKKNGFKNFFKKKSVSGYLFQENSFFFLSSLLLAFFSAGSFLSSFSLRFSKKLKVGYFLLLVLNTLLIAETAATTPLLPLFLNLNKFSDFFFFKKFLLVDYGKKFTIVHATAQVQAAVKAALNFPTKNVNDLKKFNLLLKDSASVDVEPASAPNYLFLTNNFFTKNHKFFFLRNNEIYNKSRYSRNRQTYRTGVFWCIWLTVLTVIGLYFYFYVFLIKFTYAWIFFFLFILSFFFFYFRSKIERHWFF